MKKIRKNTMYPILNISDVRNGSSTGSSINRTTPNRPKNETQEVGTNILKNKVILDDNLSISFFLFIQ